MRCHQFLKSNTDLLWSKVFHLSEIEVRSHAKTGSTNAQNLKAWRPKIFHFRELYFSCLSRQNPHHGSTKKPCKNKKSIVLVNICRLNSWMSTLHSSFLQSTICLVGQRWCCHAWVSPCTCPWSTELENLDVKESHINPTDSCDESLW